MTEQVKKVQWDNDYLEKLAKEAISKGKNKKEKMQILKNLEIVSFQVTAYLSGEIHREKV